MHAAAKLNMIVSGATKKEPFPVDVGIWRERVCRRTRQTKSDEFCMTVTKGRGRAKRRRGVVTK